MFKVKYCKYYNNVYYIQMNAMQEILCWRNKY